MREDMSLESRGCTCGLLSNRGRRARGERQKGSKDTSRAPSHRRHVGTLVSAQRGEMVRQEFRSKAQMTPLRVAFPSLRHPTGLLPYIESLSDEGYSKTHQKDYSAHLDALQL